MKILHLLSRCRFEFNVIVIVNNRQKDLDKSKLFEALISVNEKKIRKIILTVVRNSVENNLNSPLYDAKWVN